MIRSVSAVALSVVFVSPLVAAQTTSRDAKTTVNARPVTLQGCVVPGVDGKTAAVASLREIAAPGQSVMPSEAHGRHVVFWLTPDDQLVQNIGHMVEVRGTTAGIEKSEIEFKPGRQKSGGTVVEFEGPGKDVKVASDLIADSVGTTGRTSDKDLKTFVVRVNVTEVRSLPTSCK